MYLLSFKCSLPAKRNVFYFNFCFDLFFIPFSSVYGANEGSDFCLYLKSVHPSRNLLLISHILLLHSILQHTFFNSIPVNCSIVFQSTRHFLPHHHCLKRNLLILWLFNDIVKIYADKHDDDDMEAFFVKNSQRLHHAVNAWNLVVNVDTNTSFVSNNLKCHSIIL